MRGCGALSLLFLSNLVPLLTSSRDGWLSGSSPTLCVDTLLPTLYSSPLSSFEGTSFSLLVISGLCLSPSPPPPPPPETLSWKVILPPVQAKSRRRSKKAKCSSFIQGGRSPTASAHLSQPKTTLHQQLYSMGYPGKVYTHRIVRLQDLCHLHWKASRLLLRGVVQGIENMDDDHFSFCQSFLFSNKNCKVKVALTCIGT